MDGYFAYEEAFDYGLDTQDFCFRWAPFDARCLADGLAGRPYVVRWPVVCTATRELLLKAMKSEEDT